MADTSNKRWVLPADIPFADLKARDLEECVYWLLDAMGARDLEWRTGGDGRGAADGGRDLEATFYAASPDGEIDAERWWIECKGRSSTVEPDAVKGAANNALALGNLAHLVIATNTTFSNPTRDWVKTWQNSHLRPKVKLWDRATLERLLSQHPSVVLRLFSEALSPTGRLEAMRERFWNKLEFTSAKTLQTFWEGRAELQIEPLERFALIANEFANGDIELRPWAGDCDADALFATFEVGLLNTPYLAIRSSKAGVDEAPIAGALAYLLLAVLQLMPADELSAHVLTLIGERNGEALPDSMKEMLLMPIIDRLSSELQDICSADCERMSASFNRRTLMIDSIDHYWQRFERDGSKGDRTSGRTVRLERLRAPCKVGFAVNEKRMCPLFGLDPSLDNVAEVLDVLKRVSGYRREQARAAAAVASQAEP